jgi:hypothetical protein
MMAWDIREKNENEATVGAKYAVETYKQAYQKALSGLFDLAVDKKSAIAPSVTVGQGEMCSVSGYK